MEERSDVLGSTTPEGYGTDEAARAAGRAVGEVSSPCSI
jgi:hypothetical protein